MNIALLIDVAHCYARRHLKEGDWAVDATVGSGRDTLFLAETVGDAGRVYGFDIQSEALLRTRVVLAEHGCLDRVTLVETTHRDLACHLPDEARGRVRIALFNLGYLPGGDPAVITTPDSTIPALDDALAILAPAGLILITCYPAHPGGEDETRAATRWAAALPPARASSVDYRLLNRAPATPRLLIVQKQ